MAIEISLKRRVRLTGAHFTVVLILLSQFLELVQIAAAAEGRVHLVRVVEEPVVDGILAGILAEWNKRLEPVTPEDLRRKVRRPGLCRHTRRLDGALQNDDDLKFFFEKIRGRYVVERRVGRYLVDDRHRPNEEDVRLIQVHAHLLKRKATIH